METSAMENLNVEEAFLHMITKIHEIATQKSLQFKMANDHKTSTNLQAAKQINIHIDHEVTATKKSSYCCSTWIIFLSV